MPQLPITVPEGFTIIVNLHDTVRAGQVLAKKEQQNARELVIPVTELLQVSPKRLPKVLRKSPGDQIREGEVIAGTAGFITVTEVVSNILGTLVQIDRSTGEITIERQVTNGTVLPDADIVSPFDAIIERQEGSVITLNTKQDALVGAKGLGAASEGTLFFAGATDKDGVVQGGDITVAMIANIVMGNSFSREALVKASGMGIGGIVARELSTEDMSLLEEKRMVIPLLEVDEKAWQGLAKSIGKHVYLDAAARTILVS